MKNRRDSKWPATILASATIIAAAIVFASLSPATSQQRSSSYMMASGSGAYGWRVNVITGAVSYCMRRSDSSDPVYIAQNPPVCSGWTHPSDQ